MFKYQTSVCSTACIRGSREFSVVCDVEKTTIWTESDWEYVGGRFELEIVQMKCCVIRNFIAGRRMKQVGSKCILLER